MIHQFHSCVYIYLEKNENSNSDRYTQASVHSSTVCNSQVMETNHVPISRRMNRAWPTQWSTDQLWRGAKLRATRSDTSLWHWTLETLDYPKSARNKTSVLHDSMYMMYPEQARVIDTEISWEAPGYGSCGKGEHCLADNEFLFGMTIKFGNRHDSYSALWI